MKKKHLFYIIPLSIILGLSYGVYVGVEMGIASIDAFAEFACEVSLDAMELCTDILRHMVEFNGTTQDAITDYVINNNETILKIGEKYELFK